MREFLFTADNWYVIDDVGSIMAGPFKSSAEAAKSDRAYWPAAGDRIVTGEDLAEEFGPL
jgi:hypothetical protein